MVRYNQYYQDESFKKTVQLKDAWNYDSQNVKSDASEENSCL